MNLYRMQNLNVIYSLHLLFSVLVRIDFNAALFSSLRIYKNLYL